LQGTELFQDQEPEDHAGPAGDEEILPPVPEAHAAQGSEIAVTNGQRLVTGKRSLILGA
jgi:hypothetical protein